jgi:hypothetical protein
VLDLVFVSSISFATFLYYDLCLDAKICVWMPSIHMFLLSHYLVPLSFLHMSESDTDNSSDGEHFFELIHKRAKLAEIYTDLYLLKNLTRTSI